MKQYVILGILIIIASIVGVHYFSVSDTPSSTYVEYPEGSWLKALSVSTCTPESGYDICRQNAYTYGAASAYVKIQSTNMLGDSGYAYIDGANRKYYVGEVYQNLKFTGDKFYARRGLTDWGNPCMAGGCTGTAISTGKYVIASAPAKNPSYVSYIAYDYSSRSGYWCWTAVYWGWVGSSPNYNFYVIGCYDDDDCSTDEYCDNSGEWDTWTCVVDPCSTMLPAQDNCDGFDLWSQKCVRGEYQKDSLIEVNSETCGCVLPVEMPNICVGFDLYTQTQKEMCIDEYIPDILIEAKSTTCGYVCTHNETIDYTCTDGSTVVESICQNNEWIIVDEAPVKSCPINLTNIKEILTQYVNEIVDTVKETFNL